MFSVSNLSLLVEAQNIVSNAAGSPTLHLVLVPEELLAGEAPAVVQLSVCQYPQQSAFTSIHVTYYRHPER